MQLDDGARTRHSRLLGIDVLRALAIFWVIAFHLTVNVRGLDPVDDRYERFASSIGGGEGIEAVQSFGWLILRLGYQGVPLFMMLSGFVLAHNTLVRERAQTLASFYANRVRALLTPYWVAFALTTGAIVLLAFVRHIVDGDSFLRELRHGTQSGSAEYPVDGKLLLAGVTLIPRGLDVDWLLAPSPSLWFVLVFVQFYAVFPLLMIAMRRIGPKSFALACFVLTVLAKLPLTLDHDGYGLLFNWWIDSSYLPFNLFPFALGMSLAALYDQDRQFLRKLMPGWFGITLFLYLGLLIHTGGSLAQGRSGLISVFSTPMVVLGLTMATLPLMYYLDEARRPSRAWVVMGAAGSISYALLIASDPFQFVIGTMRSLSTPAWMWVVFCIGYVPALVGLAMLVTRASTFINTVPLQREARGYAGGVVTLCLAGALGLSAIFVYHVPADRDIPFQVDRPAAPMLSTQICTLLDAGGGGAKIRGLDGGTSNAIGERTYWTFGDTVLQNGALLPNTVGYSDDQEPDNCLQLTYKTDDDGGAASLLPAVAGEQTVWPAAGQISLDGRTVYFPFESVRSSDYKTGSYRFNAVGLGKFDVDNMSGTRVIDRLIAPEDFPNDILSLTPVTDLIVHDDYVYVYFSVNWNTRVMRVPADSIEDRSAYRFWDGADWGPDAARSVDILNTAGGQQAFNTAYNPALGKWMATYSTNTLSAVAMAFADAPEGPYRDEVILMDCTTLFGRGRIPRELIVFPELYDQYDCYHATRHEEFDRDGGATVYLTYANIVSYRLYLQRIVLGAPISQWDSEVGDSNVLLSGSVGPAQYLRRGVAFYASLERAPGLSPVHDWYDSSNGNHRYEVAAPEGQWEDEGIAFYASETPGSDLKAVKRWSAGTRLVYSTFDLAPLGYRDEGVAFYAAALDGSQAFNPKEGYVYWVHAKGDTDFGCCGSTNNPTRQTMDRNARFVLETPPNPAGYEAVVCSPVCGTNGTIIWSGDVGFSPNREGGVLELTPDGPK